MTKQDQLKWNKKPKITEHERKYLAWLQTFPASCFICGSIRNIEYHHVKYKSTDRKDHTKLIPLCTEHHKGNKLSPHGTPTLWREMITMERQEDMAESIYQIFIGSQ